MALRNPAGRCLTWEAGKTSASSKRAAKMRNLDSASSVVVGVDGSQVVTQRHHLGSPERVECTVLTVHGHYL